MSTIYTGGGVNSNIDDNDISTKKTWSSDKTNEEINKKTDKPTTWQNEELAEFDTLGNLKSSGKKAVDFAPVNHGHPADQISINNTNLGGNLPADLENFQEVIDAIDDMTLLAGPQGPQGPAGDDGVDGTSTLNGTVDPTPAIGNEGDFYINTTTSFIFGPKTGGAWGAGTSLVGPVGPGSGDMLKSVYDVDNTGVVDDAEKLNNENASFYLDRAKHTGTQSADTIVDGTTNGVVTLEEVSAISHNSINGKKGFYPSLSGGNTTIDFSSGDLQFVNRTTGEIVTKSYAGVAGITPTFPAGPTTYVVVDQANIGQPTLDLAISYQATYTLEDLRNGKVLLTKLGTPGGGILDLLPESWNYFDQDVSNAEFINAIAPVINEDNSNTISAGTGMTINKTSGTLLVRGGNNSITSPNRVNTSILTSPTMVSFYRDGVGGLVVTGGVTAFDPDFYDDGSGTLASVGNNQWTTNRVYLTSSNLILFEYGQAEYATKNDAIAGAFNDSYNRLVSEDSILLGVVAMKKGDTQVLNDNIRLANKIGELGSGGVASSVITTWGAIAGTLSNQTDLQNALNGKENTIGYTTENVANKSTDIVADTGSNIKYPSVKAVEDYVADNAGSASIVTYVAGEDLSVNDAVRKGVASLGENTDRVYKTDSSNINKTLFVGFNTKNVLLGENAEINIGAMVEGFSGLSVGSNYFLSEDATTATEVSQSNFSSALGGATQVIIGQTWTAVENMKVQSIECYTGSGSPQAMRIYDGFGGDLIATSTNTPQGPGGNTSETWNFSDVLIEKGKKYYFEVSSAYYYRGTSSNSYSGGNIYTNGTSGSADLAFFVRGITVGAGVGKISAIPGENSILIGRASSDTFIRTSNNIKKVISLSNPSSGVSTIFHGLGKIPSIIEVDTIRGSTSSETYTGSAFIVRGNGIFSDGDGQFCNSSYGQSEGTFSNDSVFHTGYGNDSKVVISNVDDKNIEITCTGTFNSGDNYHKLIFTING